jgi:hypothetical protein
VPTIQSAARSTSPVVRDAPATEPCACRRARGRAEDERIAHPLARVVLRPALRRAQLVQLAHEQLEARVVRCAMTSTASPRRRVPAPPDALRPVAEHDGPDETGDLQPRDGVERALVGALGEHDRALQRAGAVLHALAERNHGRLRAIRAAPRALRRDEAADVAAQRGDLADERGGQVRVVLVRRQEDRLESGHRCRFMSAIWNSYSKSDTARRPRMMMRTFVLARESTSSPVKSATSTRGSSANTLRISVDALGMSNRPLFAWVRRCATATSTRSQKPSARRTMSSWPRVMGSNEPGIDRESSAHCGAVMKVMAVSP